MTCGCAPCLEVPSRRWIGREQDQRLAGREATDGLGELDDGNRARRSGGVDGEQRVHGRHVPLLQAVRKRNRGDCSTQKLLKPALSAILRFVALSNWELSLLKSNRRADCSAANEFRRQAQR